MSTEKTDIYDYSYNLTKKEGEFYEKCTRSCRTYYCVSKKKGVTVKAMLQECKLGRDIVSSMKSGSMPSADKLGTIANYLGVSTDYLLGFTDDPTPPDKKKSNDPIIEIADLLKQIGITDEVHIKSAENILELMRKNENNAEFANDSNEDGLGTKQSG